MSAETTFFKIPQWVIQTGKIADLRGMDVKVYLAILSHADGKTGRSWPSNRRLAELAGVRVRAVIYAKKRLLSLGLIVIQHRSGSSDIYHAVLTPPGHRGCSVVHEGVQPVASPGMQPVAGITRSVEQDQQLKPKGVVLPSDIKKKAQRHTDHLLEINPGLSRKTVLGEFLKLCQIWSSNDIASVIAKWGPAAKSVGLIKYYLSQRPTAKQREDEQKRRQQQIKDKARQRTAEIANAASWDSHHKVYRDILEKLAS